MENQKVLQSDYVVKGKLYNFKKPFKDFKEVFKNASLYQKITMIINLILPGFGTVLVNNIIQGLIQFLVFAMLLFADIFLSIQISIEAIKTSFVTNLVVLGLINFGLVAMYYSSFKKNVEYNDALNKGVDYPKISPLKFLGKIGFSIKDYFANLKVQYKLAGRKEKTMLITSLFVMGLPLLAYKEFIKGMLFFFIQFVFIFYMIARGIADIENFIILDSINADPLVFGVISLVIVLLFIFFYFTNFNCVLKVVTNINSSKKLEGVKGEVKQLLNGKFYVSGLIIPVGGALLFTVIPLVFMIIVAFTNYSLVTAEGYDNLNISQNIFLRWVGLDTFKRVFYEGANLQDLLSVFSWTMIWASVATFTCYFGGLLLAMLLQKKCVKWKAFYRSLFVIAMAMPQFVSLLVMRTMFMDQGPLNQLLLSWGLIDKFIPFWEEEFLAKILILVINMWVGIPYYMLLMSGLLINIPKDQYEAAETDGASKFKQFTSITFPHIFYMTTPMLITSFVSNINNFNVIYFLTNGGTISNGISNTAYSTDILITWLYTLTMKKFDYNFGAAIGIIMFVISAVLSLVIFRKSKAYNSEEEYR